jgi:hypothetical protein
MKKLGVLLLLVTACATQQKIDVEKLKTDERIYTGKMNVTFNKKTNKDLSCDVFFNVDIAPMFRLSADGNYYFKTSRSKLTYNKIVCLHKIGNESYWVSHSFDLKRIKRVEDEDTVTTLGTINITWRVDDDQILGGATRFANDVTANTEDVGKFKIEILPSTAEQTAYIQGVVPELKDPKYKFAEKLPEKDDD